MLRCEPRSVRRRGSVPFASLAGTSIAGSSTRHCADARP